VRIFRTKGFARFCRREAIKDEALRDTMERVAQGLIDADLGGGLIKQRVAREGSGRSGGYRVMIACRLGERAFFLHGFAKSRVANISADELNDLKKVAAAFLSMSQAQLALALAEGIIEEIVHETRH
jgi:hypothetical protein